MKLMAVFFLCFANLPGVFKTVAMQKCCKSEDTTCFVFHGNEEAMKRLAGQTKINYCKRAVNSNKTCKE